MIKQRCGYLVSACKFLYGHEVGKLTIWNKNEKKKMHGSLAHVNILFSYRFKVVTDAQKNKES